MGCARWMPTPLGGCKWKSSNVFDKVFHQKILLLKKGKSHFTFVVNHVNMPCLSITLLLKLFIYIYSLKWCRILGFWEVLGLNLTAYVFPLYWIHVWKNAMEASVEAIICTINQLHLINIVDLLSNRISCWIKWQSTFTKVGIPILS